MKRQATKTSPANVRLHIRRQEVFGPNMIRGNDRVRPVELLAVTMVILTAIAFAAWRGWFL